jgi:hypothetical protein
MTDASLVLSLAAPNDGTTFTVTAAGTGGIDVSNVSLTEEYDSPSKILNIFV